MSLRELKMVIGGPQGAGLETILQVLTTALAHNGYGVLSGREYHSNIVGRHSYVLLRVSSYEIPRSLTYPVEVDICTRRKTLEGNNKASYNP